MDVQVIFKINYPQENFSAPDERGHRRVEDFSFEAAQIYGQECAVCLNTAAFLLAPLDYFSAKYIPSKSSASTRNGLPTSFPSFRMPLLLPHIHFPPLLSPRSIRLLLESPVFMQSMLRIARIVKVYLTDFILDQSPDSPVQSWNSAE